MISQANLGFSHYRDSFDVVHARAVSAGVSSDFHVRADFNMQLDKIRDFPQFLNELAQCLRPTGVLLLGDGEMQLYDEQKRPVSFSDPTSSWTHRIFFASYNAMKNRGGSIDSPSMSPTWLRGINSLTDVGWHKAFIPIGPWIYGERIFLGVSRPHGSDGRPGNDREKLLAEMLRTNCLAYISGLGPLLLRCEDPTHLCTNRGPIVIVSAAKGICPKVWKTCSAKPLWSFVN